MGIYLFFVDNNGDSRRRAWVGWVLRVDDLEASSKEGSNGVDVFIF